MRIGGGVLTSANIFPRVFHGRSNLRLRRVMEDDAQVPLMLVSSGREDRCDVAAQARQSKAKDGSPSSEKLEIQDEKLNTSGPQKNARFKELSVMDLVAGGGQRVLFGLRVPKHYFMVKGFGETNAGDGVDPWETGAYDLALENAGIQDFNVTEYTSVMPPEAEKLSYEEARPFFRHGAVLESIMASMNGVKGDRVTAGVGRILIRRKKDKTVVAGYAAEYEGHARESQAKKILQGDLAGIFGRRFNRDEYEIFEEDFVIQESEVEKNFGSVIAAICFISFVQPVYVST